MSRQVVSPGELVRILTERVRKHPKGSDKCPDVPVIRRPLWDGGKVSEGHNWTVGGYPGKCADALADVAREAQKEFNLKQDDDD